MLWTRPGCGLFLFSSPKAGGGVHFDFTQGHVTKNQPMAAPVFLSESLRMDGFHCDVIKL